MRPVSWHEIFYKEHGKTLAQRGEGCPIPGNIQGWVGWSSEQCGLWEGIPIHDRGLEQGDFEGFFQSKPLCDLFYDSMKVVRGSQNQLGGHNSEREERKESGCNGSLVWELCLPQKAGVRDNPSVELWRVPSPAAGPGSANAEDIQRALSQCQARSSCDKGRFVSHPLRLPAHGKLQKFPC